MQGMFTWTRAFVSVSFLIYVQSRQFVKMSTLIEIPSCVKGLKILDKSLFAKTVDFPCLEVDSHVVPVCVKCLSNYLIKLYNFRYVQLVDTSLNESKHIENSLVKKRIFLDPSKVNSYSDFSKPERIELEKYGISVQNFTKASVNLTYDNWKADEILKAVLPEGKEIASSFSIIGHIVHVNLKEHLLDYKYVIGQVLLDKVKTARTVVNKVNTIDTDYRFFKMEILCGDNDLVAEVKENKCMYKFDFSKVYWNPRLVSEHERLVLKLNAGDILYDVFAGVGPFSIPAAKKKCTVLANDLNPESFKWLSYNIKLNKVGDFVQAFNKDGTSFIQEDVKNHLLKTQSLNGTAHIVMNLPASAVMFLDAFQNLFTMEEIRNISSRPVIHIYCFVKDANDSKQMAKRLIEERIGQEIDAELREIVFVRNVAPNKDMIRVCFTLPEDFLLGKSSKRKFDSIDFQLDDNNSDSTKRPCVR